MQMMIIFGASIKVIQKKDKTDTTSIMNVSTNLFLNDKSFYRTSSFSHLTSADPVDGVTDLDDDIAYPGDDITDAIFARHDHLDPFRSCLYSPTRFRTLK